MHRGVRQLVNWVAQHREGEGIKLNPPATSVEIAALEQMLGGPLPIDLSGMLKRFNGGVLPSGTMLCAGIDPGTIGAAVREYAESVKMDFLDNQLLLPFLRTNEGSLLCFDRSAGPVSDTWPIVDYFEDEQTHRLMFRTFDGWCRYCVDEWETEDLEADFTLDSYLRAGQRHVHYEPDVSTAHATVAHALRRAGRPEEALAAYVEAARCVPALPWCDWEALKLATLLGHEAIALESANRLCLPAPERWWALRETSPLKVAQLIRVHLEETQDRASWIRLLHQLASHVTRSEREQLSRVISAYDANRPLPTLFEVKGDVFGTIDALPAWKKANEEAYLRGELRDEELLFHPQLRAAFSRPERAALLTIRRDF